jgi:arginine/lysine/ornithine decarboxylase
MEQLQEKPQQQTKVISGIPEQYFNNAALNKAIAMLHPNCIALTNSNNN